MAENAVNLLTEREVRELVVVHLGHHVHTTLGLAQCLRLSVEHAVLRDLTDLLIDMTQEGLVEKRVDPGEGLEGCTPEWRVAYQLWGLCTGGNRPPGNSRESSVRRLFSRIFGGLRPAEV